MNKGRLGVTRKWEPCFEAFPLPLFTAPYRPTQKRSRQKEKRNHNNKGKRSSALPPSPVLPPNLPRLIFSTVATCHDEGQTVPPLAARAQKKLYNWIDARICEAKCHCTSTRSPAFSWPGRSDKPSGGKRGRNWYGGARAWIVEDGAWKVR